MSSPSSVQIISRSGNRIKFEVQMELTGSLLDMESTILSMSNPLGCCATAQALHRFDTDASPIEVGGIKLTSRTQSNKTYYSPYGPVDVVRPVYQTSRGGRIDCPLEASARVIQSATPRMAKLLSSKYARLNANETRHDLADNHGCTVSVNYLQKVTERVGAIAQAKEEAWSYQTPQFDEEVEVVSLSLEGGRVLMRDGARREAMAGCISLYDGQGQRLHSIYLGASPEYGKASFKQRFIAEAEHVKSLYPEATRVGIADGASDNWSLLTPLTQYQILDFHHATEYLARAANGAHPEKTGKSKRKAWLNEQCHRLEHDSNGAQKVLTELKRVGRKHLTKETKDKVKDAIRYFTHQRPMMDYAGYREKQFPIGSGVTEAACKTLIKQRLCRSGMRWKEKGLKTVLSLRALVLTQGRWQQFWERINQCGIEAWV
ncbi:MAG: ISKra4 family transposase [Gammaproteobacteria bacterium]|nr:ISKra4 family transposase [Gammaproteobacteria bacterium]